jgi:hypothetical protein
VHHSDLLPWNWEFGIDFGTPAKSLINQLVEPSNERFSPPGEKIS